MLHFVLETIKVWHSTLCQFSNIIDIGCHKNAGAVYCFQTFVLQWSRRGFKCRRVAFGGIYLIKPVAHFPKSVKRRISVESADATSFSYVYHPV